MSQIEQVIAAILFALGQHLPRRIVTNNLVDFADRKPSELEKGVYTLMFVRQSDFSDYAEKVDLLLVGQVALPESATGADVQAAELKMLDEVKGFIKRAPLDLFRMQATKSASSAQLETPYGWISFDLTIGPFDSSDFVLPGCGEDELTQVNVKYDVPPFASKTQHDELLNDEVVPGQPDAEDDIPLEQS